VFRRITPFHQYTYPNQERLKQMNKPDRIRKKRMVARASVAGAIALASALAVSACASGASTPEATKSNRDTVVVALPSALTTNLDPNSGGPIRLDGSLQSAIYSSLTTINPKLELVGDLATKWKLADDGNGWIFTIRKDATFQNGDPLDANVIAANVNSIISEKKGSLAALGGVTGAQAIDAATVLITTSGPFLDLPRRLSQVFFLDQAWVKAGHDPKTESNASGPYMVVSYNQQTEVVLKKNPKYYGTPAEFENAKYVVIPTAAGRLAALQAHEVDLSITIDPQDLPILEKDTALTVGAVASNRSQMIRFSTARAPFDNVKVREAINYGVDKKAIADSVLRGLVGPSQGQVLTKDYTGFDPDLKAFPYDPKKAKQLLTEAGYPDGLTFTLDVPTGAYVGVDLTAQAIQAQLAKIGVTVKLNVLDFSAWLASIGSADGPLNASFVGYASNDNSTSQILGYFVSNFVQEHADDPTYDAIYAKLRAATTEKDQLALAKQALERQQEFVPLLWLFPQPQTFAYSSDLKWVPRIDDWLRPQDLHLK
jgi:peptide/nickel transport system substrate-binding protein